MESIDTVKIQSSWKSEKLHFRFSLSFFTFPQVPAASFQSAMRNVTVRMLSVVPVIHWRFLWRKLFILINWFWLKLFVGAHHQLNSLHFVCYLMRIHSSRHMYMLPEDYKEAQPWN